MQKIKNKKIYVIYTGGTIGMVKNHVGCYIPQKGYLLKKIRENKSFYNKNIPNFKINEYEKIIDSSNIRPKNWIKISMDIFKNYYRYDGFVILHGTDTMCYTASILSFIFKNLTKPIICTGSQIPISELRSDALDNIINSLILASYNNISEVCIYFNKKLFRGNRSVKIHTSNINAFDSPNYPILGSVDNDAVKLNKKFLYKCTNYKPIEINLKKFNVPSIIIFAVFPGMNLNILKSILNLPLHGLILKTYGHGNIINSYKVINYFSQACDKGMIIINCTQSLKGSIDMNLYQTGKNLIKTGIISGYDMTCEAALMKFFYLFNAFGMVHKKIKKAWHKNLRGEVTL